MKISQTDALYTNFGWAQAHVTKLSPDHLADSELKHNFPAYCVAIFGEARELCIRKEKDYGSTWVTLGAKGLMVYMRAKMGRLWNLLWKGQTAAIKDEAVRDTLIDVINYCFFILYCLDTDNLLGTD